MRCKNYGYFRSAPIKRKLLLALVLIVLAGTGYYWRRRAFPPSPIEAAYVLPESVGVVDSPAQIRLGVTTLKQGDRIEVLERTRNWSKIRLADGRTGWVESLSLLDSDSYERGQQLVKELQREQPQAAGHVAYAANLRVEPSRDAPQLIQLPANTKVDVFGRRVMDRPTQPGASPSEEPARDVWYLVRVESKAGWVLGRLITLDVPEAIAHYAQSINLVGWLVLNTVEDNGRQVPQYLVADREGTAEFDFTHIRIFTWWAKRQQYVTAYVEGNLNGYFPIRVSQVDGAPHFRLRLVDSAGRKYQRVYRLYDTIARPLGTVDGWESQAMPVASLKPSRAPIRRRHR